MSPALSLVRLPSELRPGLHLDVAPETYHQREIGVINRSALDQFAKSPLTYLTWVRGELPDRETDAMRLGNAFHCAALEPARFARHYAIEPDYGHCQKHDPSGTTKEQGARNRELRDAWRAKHAGATLLSAEDGEMIAGMTRALRSHPKVSKILARGIAESVVRWDDRELGLPCKARPDFLIDDLELCVDLKSTLDASEGAFTRDIFNLGYDLAVAHYKDGLAEIGRTVEDMILIAVEKTPPYLIGLYDVSPQDEQAARETNRALMARLQRCLFANDWPGLPIDIVTARRPPWFRRSM